VGNRRYTEPAAWNKPSISSIYRLEQGEAIRMSSARRVFDVVNAALNNALDPGRELEMSW